MSDAITTAPFPNPWATAPNTPPAEPAVVEEYRIDEWPEALRESLCMKICRIVYDILSVIIFPIGLIRLIGWGVRSLMVGGVLPASYENYNHPFKRAELDYLLANLFNGAVAQRIEMVTPDGVKLEGLYVKQSDAPDAKTVVCCNPNGMHMAESCYSVVNTLQDTHNNYLFFNYRGVGASEGAPTPEGLLLDGWTALMTARTAYNVAAENILLHGRSLGGAIATFVASQAPGVACCNERSFATLPAEASYLADYFVTQCLGGCLGSVAGCLARFLSWSSGWDWNVQKWWGEITGHKWILYHPYDEIIGYEASLAKAVGPNEPYVIRMSEEGGHNTPLSQTDLWAHKARMMQVGAS